MSGWDRAGWEALGEERRNCVQENLSISLITSWHKAESGYPSLLSTCKPPWPPDGSSGPGQWWTRGSWSQSWGQRALLALSNPSPSWPQSPQPPTESPLQQPSNHPQHHQHHHQHPHPNLAPQICLAQYNVRSKTYLQWSRVLTISISWAACMFLPHRIRHTGWERVAPTGVEQC